MKRCVAWMLILPAVFAASVRADEVPALPQKLTFATWTYAKIANDADGKPLVMIYRDEVRIVKELRAVTKLEKQTRIVDGQTITLEIPKTETVPVDVSVWVWKASVAAQEDPRVQFTDANGKAIAAETVRERLAKTTVVKWAEEQPDPFFLRSLKSDSMVLVAPSNAFAELPGAVKESLPVRGSSLEDAFAKISMTAGGKRQIEILELDVKETKQGEKVVWQPKWTIGQVPCDHPTLRIADLQGKAIDASTVRLDKWTPIVIDTEGKPHPLAVGRVKPELLLVMVDGPVLFDTQRDLGQPQRQPAEQPKSKIDNLPLPPLPPSPVDAPRQPQPQPQPTGKIDRLPLPPLPPFPVSPQPQPVQPEPKIPVGANEPKAEAAPGGAPPIPIVKKLLEVQWGPLGRSTKHVYDFKSIRFGPPLKEAVTINGQGTFTGKIRYPVRVLCDITVNFTDGTSRMETKHSTFHFFQDSFNEWSFRFIENN